MKRRIKRLFNLLGLSLRKRHLDPDFQMLHSIAHTGYDVVLDVGANLGQFGADLRMSGYRGRIVSFEPIPGCYARLARTAAADRAWTCRQVALGASRAQALLHRASNDGASSSLLPMTGHHQAAAPAVRTLDTELVQVETLAGIWPGLGIAPTDRILLKIDTQGYEREVLAGAAEYLPRIAGVLCEMSTVELYAGSPLYFEIDGVLRQAGFALTHLSPELYGPRGGGSRLAQFNALFERELP